MGRSIDVNARARVPEGNSNRTLSVALQRQPGKRGIDRLSCPSRLDRKRAKEISATKRGIELAYARDVPPSQLEIPTQLIGKCRDNKYLDMGDDAMRAAEYPLLLIRDDGSIVLRGALVVNDDKSIGFAGTVPEGAKVKFSMSPGPEIIDHVIIKPGKFDIWIFDDWSTQNQAGTFIQVTIIRQLFHTDRIGSYMSFKGDGSILSDGFKNSIIY